MRRNADRTWHGDSQDGASFVKAQIDHGAIVQGARVLLIGAGGAGSAIAIALLAAGAGALVVFDINEARVHQLISLLADKSKGRMKYGPPGCASKTSISSSLRRNISRPALIRLRVGVGFPRTVYFATPLCVATGATSLLPQT